MSVSTLVRLAFLVVFVLFALLGWQAGDAPRDAPPAPTVAAPAVPRDG